MEDAAHQQSLGHCQGQQERPDGFTCQVIAMIGGRIERGGDEHLPLFSTQAGYNGSIRRVFPEWLAPLDCRWVQKVIARRRRTGRPFQCSRPPGIVTRKTTTASAPKDVYNEH